MQLKLRVGVNDVNEFAKILQKQLTDYYTDNYPNLKAPTVTIHTGRKYSKIVVNGSAWAFIANADGFNKGVICKKGDVFKPASWASPAKHSRGNILNGNFDYTVYGPHYIK